MRYDALHSMHLDWSACLCVSVSDVFKVIRNGITTVKNVGFVDEHCGAFDALWKCSHLGLWNNATHYRRRASSARERTLSSVGVVFLLLGSLLNPTHKASIWQWTMFQSRFGDTNRRTFPGACVLLPTTVCVWFPSSLKHNFVSLDPSEFVRLLYIH